MAITITRSTKDETRATGVTVVTNTDIPGVAVRGAGEAIHYRAVGLVESEAPTLHWSPAVYGQTLNPEPGDVVTWGSVEYRVVRAFPYDPDGLGWIAAKVIIKR